MASSSGHQLALKVDDCGFVQQIRKHWIWSDSNGKKKDLKEDFGVTVNENKKWPEELNHIF